MTFQFRPRFPVEWKGKNVLIYDGECPFCSQFVAFQRIRSALGSLTLVDARENPGLVADFEMAGKPLDEGMALVIGEDIYYGADCLNRLALMSSGSGFFNRMSALVFKSPMVSRMLYPALKAGRRVTLMILGKRKLGPSTTY
ncbi:DCC1-like thiol-disulfide oxidoreductase family protein [Rhizobium leguminosarum]|uniref:DCC1-like thiol-disulfide oxidoreductase family protein n=1 Tax=Rhizobium leguminosarum TaxID=384 RepID=UPI003CC8D264